ncbi:AraC family transcriptional regulator [Georgfuchsia toluolica]|nr:AraC family transcriptional regulator [Georgfuchsia toluolica]
MPRNRHRATVAIGFVNGMLSGLASHHIESNDLLKASGIDSAALSNPEGRVPLKNYAALYNALVQQLGDEGFSLFSKPLPVGTFEFLCRSMVSSKTLAEALDRGSRFLHLVLPDLKVTITRNRGTAGIEIAETRPLSLNADDSCRMFAFEWLLRLLHGLACWLVGRELHLGSVRFPYSRPAYAADYDLIYTPCSMFGGQKLIASMKANLLDLPIRRDDDALEGFLEGAPGKIAMLYRRDREMVHQVRNLLAQAFPEPITLGDIAHKLNLSPRTLHRRLQEEDSSFRGIKDALRRDMALSQIEKSGLPISKIAASLGFSEPSTFFRAFQAWTGVAPTTYRNRLASKKTTRKNTNMH